MPAHPSHPIAEDPSPRPDHPGRGPALDRPTQLPAPEPPEHAHHLRDRLVAPTRVEPLGSGDDRPGPVRQVFGAGDDRPTELTGPAQAQYRADVGELQGRTKAQHYDPQSEPAPVPPATQDPGGTPTPPPPVLEPLGPPRTFSGSTTGRLSPTPPEPPEPTAEPDEPEAPVKRRRPS